MVRDNNCTGTDYRFYCCLFYSKVQGPERRGDFKFCAICGNIFGYFCQADSCCSELVLLRGHPVYIFAFRKGGLAIQGAMIGGIVALIIFCKIRKLDFWLWADILAPGLILGQAIGRWGNFFNQEAFGRPISLHWQFFYIEHANRPYD